MSTWSPSTVLGECVQEDFSPTSVPSLTKAFIPTEEVPPTGGGVGGGARGAWFGE